MTKEKAIKSMTIAFKALTEKQKGNLIWHYENRTPILCGIPEASSMYIFEGEG